MKKRVSLIIITSPVTKIKTLVLTSISCLADSASRWKNSAPPEKSLSGGLLFPYPGGSQAIKVYLLGLNFGKIGPKSDSMNPVGIQ